MAQSTMTVSPAFDNFIFDWDYETYLLVGSYGSGKSVGVAQKVIIKLLEEKRKALIVRDVYATHKESTFDLIKEELTHMDLLAEQGTRKSTSKVCWKLSPLEFTFPNSSKIIFKGMDSTDKVKSLNGVSIVWIEECSEVAIAAYMELQGRIRTPDVSMHFILSCNPVGKFNWVYQHFFSKTLDNGKVKVLMDEKSFYKNKALVRKNIYYHHSTCDDNPFLPPAYIKRLDDMEAYDRPLWLVARHGRFGASGLRVLPQFEVLDASIVNAAVGKIGSKWHRIGMDFGFETSFNAVVKMAIDDTNKWLYIYKEYYKNHMTDDKTAIDLVKWDTGIKSQLIKADCAEPKAIQFYKQEGYTMRACKKLADKKTEGSRIANTKKIKRFQRIICSSDCINYINECKDLTYKKNKDGSLNFGEFNIDPHTFSATWYGLDDYTVADVKERKHNSIAGK